MASRSPSPPGTPLGVLSSSDDRVCHSLLPGPLGAAPTGPDPVGFCQLSSQGLPGRKFILGAGSLGAAPKGLWKMSRVQGFGLWIPAPAQVHGDQKCGSDPLAHCTDCHLDALQRCYFPCAPWCGFGTRGNDSITSARCLHVF